MSLRDRLLDDLKSAMKSQDQRRLATLRMLEAEMLESEVNLRAAKGLDYHLDEAETTRVLAVTAETGAKSRTDLGAGMKAAMARLQGAADGKLVNRIASEHLEGQERPSR